METIASTWLKNIQECLSSDILCSKMRTKNVWELRGTDNVQRQTYEYIFCVKYRLCNYYPSNIWQRAPNVSFERSPVRFYEQTDNSHFLLYLLELKAIGYVISLTMPSFSRGYSATWPNINCAGARTFHGS